MYIYIYSIIFPYQTADSFPSKLETLKPICPTQRQAIEFGGCTIVTDCGRHDLLVEQQVVEGLFCSYQCSSIWFELAAIQCNSMHVWSCTHAFPHTYEASRHQWIPYSMIKGGFLKCLSCTFMCCIWYLLPAQTRAQNPINPDQTMMNSSEGCPDHKWRLTSSRYSTYVRRWTAFSPHQPKVIQYWHPPQGVKQ